jgi:hypothetical protein
VLAPAVSIGRRAPPRGSFLHTYAIYLRAKVTINTEKPFIASSACLLFCVIIQFKMADLNLQEIHDFMISIAKQAGERIVAAKPTTEGAGSKKNCKRLFPQPK